jgi:hypothetical protein
MLLSSCLLFPRSIVSRLVNLPNSVGIDPESWLYARSSVRRLVNLPNSVGIDPKRFTAFLKLSDSSEVSNASSEGNDPAKRLLSARKDVRERSVGFESEIEEPRFAITHT